MNPGFRGVGGFGREFESIVVGVALTVFVLGVEYMVGACCQVAVEVVGQLYLIPSCGEFRFGEFTVVFL